MYRHITTEGTGHCRTHAVLPGDVDFAHDNVNNDSYGVPSQNDIRRNGLEAGPQEILQQLTLPRSSTSMRSIDQTLNSPRSPQATRSQIGSPVGSPRMASPRMGSPRSIVMGGTGGTHSRNVSNTSQHSDMPIRQQMMSRSPPNRTATTTRITRCSQRIAAMARQQEDDTKDIESVYLPNLMRIFRQRPKKHSWLSKVVAKFSR
ncbi:predicted protein [Uncinocarpus reesii 1704]|uniref:Uncharacterized protein n=1 Tax=Uncinocarpus reesii (strain UAMH 1704) TaxID=336963 RepID=C4JEA5_UNCRE|nr:uncharacterized protein UREG_00527 [Uncinocarpus reesii 1704]EEP75681.1 predicted protein [Uncinocarpus reesii 1704]